MKNIFVSGNFNILHPGHLRFLKFAKECGDLLTVGIYPDGGKNVTVKLIDRIDALQSLSFVDNIVIIEDTLNDTLRKLKPNIVVKGSEHEYSINPELDILGEFGGKLIFSSGEIKFSSKDLLLRELNLLNHFELDYNFLKRHQSNLQKIRDILTKVQAVRVLVIGDLIIDEYVSCDPIGMSQEDFSVVVSRNTSKSYIGGAGIVASHAAGFGAEVTFLSVAGNDSLLDFAKTKLDEYGVNHHILQDETRPTTLKTRYKLNNKTLFRLSELRSHLIGEDIRLKMLNYFNQISNNLDVVIFSDFNCGCLPQNLVDNIIEICNKKNIAVSADCQSSSQIGDISRYKNIKLITPTEQEARIALKDQNSGLAHLSENLAFNNRIRNIILTLGPEGVLISNFDLENKSVKTDKLNAFNVNPIDFSGAGDSLLIASSLALTVGASLWESSFIGSLAAAIQIRRSGNIPITYKEILDVLNT